MTRRELQELADNLPRLKAFCEKLQSIPPEEIVREMLTWTAEEKAAFRAGLDRLGAECRDKLREINSFLAGQPLISEN